MQATTRYHLMIQTGPGQQWMHPQGWTATGRTDARAMRQQAARLWHRVRVVRTAEGR